MEFNGIINEERINYLIDETINTNEKEIIEIINKSRSLKGLSLKETAALLNCNDQKLIKEMFRAAKDIKNKIYGKRIVLFAPLYVSNECNNNCLYCGFRRDNKELIRKTLNTEEIKEDVRELLKQGQKRILLVAGESQKSHIEYMKKVIEAIYSVEFANNKIRRVNVNCAPLSVQEFRTLKSTGIGTFQLFQETYHKETYKQMHPNGLKKDYHYRLEAMSRAFKAGIDDLGIGVLLGLYNYKFEILAMLMHAQYLEKNFGVGPHTVSVPRIEPAHNAPVSQNLPNPVTDNEFRKIVAILRLAVPYTGIILSTRETGELRNELLDLGVSQISAGSKTNPGGYTSEEPTENKEQFSLHDSRTMRQVILDMLEIGYIPSFCTACYRTGRTGKDFMDMAKPGLIQKFCLPNCLLTFKEYLVDFGDDLLINLGNRVIEKQLQDVHESVQEKTKQRLQRLDKGEKDMYF